MSAHDDVHARGIWATGIVSVGIGVVAVIVATVIGDGRLATRGSQAAPPLPSGSAIPERTSILDTRRGLDAQRAAREELGRYGWVDRERGIARIPIERAMDLVADGGP